ncbi:MAG TPA: hypothetical protein GX733_00505 [Tissierellia bacterium]|jgi:hypothetical protein|nr:hypothetical protein [Tissierellia bacterium]
MDNATSTLTQSYRFTQDGQEFVQVNVFYPDLTLTMTTYMYLEGAEPSDDDILYELYYSVQESKYDSLQRHIEKSFSSLPDGLSQSPAYLQLANGKTERKYSWQSEGVMSEAFQELDAFVTRIATYSSIPSG